MPTLMERPEYTDRVAALADAGFVALAVSIPWIAIGSFRFRVFGRLSIAGSVLVAISPIVIFQVWRQRRALWRNLVVIAISVFGLGGMLSDLLNGMGAISGGIGAWRMASNHPRILLVVVGMAATYRVRSIDRLLRWFVRSAALALGLSLVGYLGQIFLLHGRGVVRAFALFLPHPVLGAVPRLTGTYGRSPEHFAEFVLLVVMLVSMAVERGVLTRRWRWLLVLAGVALVLTLSIAAATGVILGAYALVRSSKRRWLRVSAVGGVLMALSLLSWVVNVGLPYDGPTRGLCHHLESGYRVAGVSLPFSRNNKERLCRLAIATSPYRRAITLYWESKRFGVEAFVEHPLIGIGSVLYPRNAQSSAEKRYFRGGTTGVSIYGAPHSIWFSTGATHGVIGVLALVLLVFALWSTRSLRDMGYRWVWLGTVVFMFIGIDIAVLYVIPFRFLLGVLALAEEHRREGRLV